MVETLNESQAPNRAGRRGQRDRLRGYVVSDKAPKTIRVRCEYMRKHPKYGKYLRRTTTAHAHDETNEAKVGDLVELVATRPLSRLKRWRLLRVISRAGE